jgi:hypothetical protein
MRVEWVGLMDIDEVGGDTITIKYKDGNTETITFMGLGDNSVQWVDINKNYVMAVIINFAGSGATSGIGFCEPLPDTASPSESPSSFPTPQPTPVPTRSPVLPPTTPEPTPVPTAKPTPSPTPFPSSLTPTMAPIVPVPLTGCKMLDFEYDSDGKRLTHMNYIKDQFYGYFGLTITAKARNQGYTPGGRARIFDSANPGPNANEGDPDLGTPNEKCPLRCNPDTLISFEDFEDNLAPGWSNPRVENGQTNGCAAYTSFLGRFSNDTPMTEKTYINLPKDASKITVQFSLYELDSFDGKAEEQMYVFIDGKTISLGVFKHNVDEGTRSGEVAGIKWYMTSDTLPNSLDNCFNQWSEQKHRVTLEIPPQYYRIDGSIAMGFRVVGDEGYLNESGGLDNIKIIAHTDCANPGQGWGGEPGTKGENCQFLGNILIIQESNKDRPDDNHFGK